MSLAVKETIISIEDKKIPAKVLDCFIIRRATIDDVEAIQNITRESFSKYMKDSGLTGTIKALSETPEDILRDILKKNVYVSLIDSKPVGSIRVHALSDDSAYISRFGVLPDYHSLGIGKSLLSHIEEKLKAQGIKKVFLHTASAHKNLMCFYYSRGFYVDSTTKDRGYTRALMVKDLG